MLYHTVNLPCFQEIVTPKGECSIKSSNWAESNV